MPKTALTDELYAYCLAKGVRESQALQDLRAESEKLSNGRMLLSRDQGALLAMLARLTNSKRYLEIGMFTGYSALWVAEVLPRDGRVVALDISDEHLPLAKRYWLQAGQADKIQVQIAPALTSLTELQQAAELFDLILIDANKAEYLAYYEAALNLLRPGGLCVIDNVLMYGQVLADKPEKNYVKVLQQLNDRLQADNRIDLCLLPLGDGMTLARKKDDL